MIFGNRCRWAFRLAWALSLVVQSLDGFKNFVCKSEVFESYEGFVAQFLVRVVGGTFCNLFYGFFLGRNFFSDYRFCAAFFGFGVIFGAFIFFGLFDFAFFEFDFCADFYDGC